MTGVQTCALPIYVPKILETPWVAVDGSDKKVPPYKEEIAWLLK